MSILDRATRAPTKCAPLPIRRAFAGGLSVVAAAAAAVALAAGCGESTSGDFGGSFADAGAGRPECFSSNECPTGWTCSEFGTCVEPPAPSPDGGVAPPPETEYELGDPVSSLRYIYVAMTELDALARIDGQTLAVSSLSVGESPREVVATPNSDTAVVLDSINGTATIVRPTAQQDVKKTVATLPHLNRIVIDPSGTYAVSWFDLNKAVADSGGLGVTSVGSFQDVTIIDLTLGQEVAVDLTVGFRPRDVQFDRDGTRAYVITEDGISVIDLGAAIGSGPSIVPPIPVTGDPFMEPDAIEVHVVSSGEYAVVREAGESMVRILSLTGSGAGSSWQIALPAEPTDVDLSPDGARAYAVLRDTSQLAIIDVPGDGPNPASIDLVDLGGELIGSLVLSGDGARGLLFTNAVASERITVIDLVQPGFPHQTYPLQKSVRLAKFSPAGDKAMIIHAKSAGDPDTASTFDEFIDRSYGYSLFDVSQGFAKLQVTPVDPGAFSFPSGARLAFLILDGGDAEGAIAQVHTIELDTGVVREANLGSPPDAVGVLPSAGVAFVSQRHPLGRVSFIDLQTGERRTITGFDLNSRIID